MRTRFSRDYGTVLRPAISPSFKDLTIKGLDEGTYLQVKAEAVRRGLSVGEVINEAMRMWLKWNQLEALRKWKYEIMEKIRRLNETMELAGAYSEEAYKDMRQEYKGTWRR